MLLVVDANILFAAAIKESTTFDILFSDKFELIAPEYAFLEFKKHRGEILDKTGRTNGDFEKFLYILEDKIKTIPAEEINQFLKIAKNISPDPNDVPYFALALRYDAPIWSNDKALKKQSKVKILSTQEVLKIF